MFATTQGAIQSPDSTSFILAGTRSCSEGGCTWKLSLGTGWQGRSSAMNLEAGAPAADAVGTDLV